MVNKIHFLIEGLRRRSSIMLDTAGLPSWFVNWWCPSVPPDIIYKINPNARYVKFIGKGDNG